MALKGKAQETTTTADDQVTDKAEETVENSVENTEVAVKTETAVAKAGVPKISAFITNPLFLEAVAGATYGTFPSVVASNGTHMSGEFDLGKTIKFQAIIAKEVKKIVPGSNDDEAKEFFQVSNDGETVADGRSLEEALQDAHDAGYEKASIKKYIDVIAIVTESENPDFVNETVTLQLAPTSCFSWRPLEGQCKMKAAMGTLKSEPVLGNPELGSAVIFTSKATAASFNNNNFTKMVFSI